MIRICHCILRFLSRKSPLTPPSMISGSEINAIWTSCLTSSAINSFRCRMLAMKSTTSPDTISGTSCCFYAVSPSQIEPSHSSAFITIPRVRTEGDSKFPKAANSLQAEASLKVFNFHIHSWSELCDNSSGNEWIGRRISFDEIVG